MIRVPRAARLVMATLAVVLGLVFLISGSADPVLAVLITLAGFAMFWEVLMRDRPS